MRPPSRWLASINVTSHPPRPSSPAAASPLIPPPTTITLFPIPYYTLGQDFFHHLAMHICQSKIPTLETIGQLGVFYPKEMQNRRMQIVHVNFSFRRVKSKIIRPAIANTRLNSAPGQPDSVTVRMMIATALIKMHEANAALY